MFGSDPRTYSVLTSEFRGEGGRVKSLVTQQVTVDAKGVNLHQHCTLARTPLIPDP